MKINAIVPGSSGQTPFSLAAKREMWDIVDILTKHGADVNVKGEKYIFPQPSDIDTTFTGSSGETGLIVAAERGNSDLVKLLINAGADVDAKGKKYIRYNFRELKP